MRVTRQPEYFSKPFGELSWLQRVLFIAHLAFGIPFALVIIAAPFVGLWQIIFGDAITGVVTMVAGLGIWIASAVVNRF